VAGNSDLLMSVLGGAVPAGGGTPSPGGDQAIALLVEQVEQLRAANQVQASVVEQNTAAVTSNTASQSSTGGGLQSVSSAISKMNGNAMSVSPLIGGLMKLFGGGGDSKTPPPLMVYAPPEAVSFEGQVTRSTNTVNWSGSEGVTSGTPVAASAPQITVQVNAMDSQSFLDHSQEIAAAVRQAMLNSHALNDVVSDL
jgi:hypothetical protein